MSGEKWTHGQRTEFGTLHANTVYTEAGESVALVYGVPNNTDVEDVGARWSEGLRRARLIASAPKLLEACQMIAAIHAGEVAEAGSALGQIRAAIAEATAGQA